MSTDEVLFLCHMTMCGWLPPCHEGAAGCRPDCHLFSVSLWKSSLAQLHASLLSQLFLSFGIKCVQSHIHFSWYCIHDCFLSRDVSRSCMHDCCLALFCGCTRAFLCLLSVLLIRTTQSDPFIHDVFLSRFIVGKCPMRSESIGRHPVPREAQRASAKCASLVFSTRWEPGISGG